MDIINKNLTPSLTPEQTNGLNILLNNQFCFVTGCAGSGKTYLVNYYTKNYCQNKKVVKVAYSAICANNLPKDKDEDLVGTIHSIFKLKFGGVIKPSKKPDFESLKNLFSTIDILIIDEISMVRIDLFEYLIKLLAKANQFRSNPIQIIFVGDFYQLPPIVSNEDKALLKKYFNTETGYIFESTYFAHLPVHYCTLNLNIRSGQDKNFDHFLDNIKQGNDLKTTLDFFNKRVSNNLKPEAGTVELYATNKMVDKVNNACLKSLKGKATIIPAYFDDEVLSAIKSKKLSNKNLPCLLKLKLKQNAQVIFTINDKIVDGVQRFANGDLATVVSCSQEEVVVKLLKNDKLVHLHKYNCSYPIYKVGGQPYNGQFKQYPLKLAYAITIHKAQGKTFNKVNLNLESNHNLSPGQVYVALSRVKSINDLYLYKPLELKDITMDKKVIDFYKSIDVNNIKDKLFK